jgi:hypothetical protein
MAFITDLPVSTTGFDAVLVFVDKLTKMVHLSPTTGTCSATELATLFVKDVYRLHGLPQQFVHDRGTVFMSNFFTKVCSALGIQNFLVLHIILKRMGRQKGLTGSWKIP